MTAKAQNIEHTFKELPPEEQAELFGRLETIVYGEENADRISFARDQEMAEGKITPLSEDDLKRRFREREM